MVVPSPLHKSSPRTALRLVPDTIRSRVRMCVSGDCTALEDGSPLAVDTFQTMRTTGSRQAWFRRSIKPVVVLLAPLGLLFRLFVFDGVLACRWGSHVAKP